MARTRLIARLDVKAPNLIKGVHLEGLRKIGDPNEYARKYYQQGADEILYMDVVASLYERNSLLSIIKETTKDVFVPITVGGGLRSVHDVEMALKSGADKVAVNTAAVKKPALLQELAERFGSQCIVLSIEAKKNADGTWEAFVDNGREHTGLDVFEWAVKAEGLGIGEILLTSVDMEGTKKGFDVELVRKMTQTVSVPVIASGGMGTLDHAKAMIDEAAPSAIAVANVLHYETYSIQEISTQLRKAGYDLRDLENA